MSDKFDMKLVIDAVTTPLLHARLCQANSYRQRAALLRSLAEAALRGSPGACGPEQQMTARDLAAPPRESTVCQPTPGDSHAPTISVELAPTEVASAEAGGLRYANDVDLSPSHDVDQIADAFGGFF
jgi:hypothetical protein